MDGNGRWATVRNLPRIAGHRRGADALDRVVQAAPDLGITDLTVYAFSCDNWKRPPEEVRGLMGLFRTYLKKEIDRCRDQGVRLFFIGRRDRLAPGIQALMNSAERDTEHCSRLRLRIAIDYSSRDALVNAARRCAEHRDWSREALAAALPAPDVDLLIRTAGEQRLSDFLLWEAAYAEFFFTECLWPDFGHEQLLCAVQAYRGRHRKFGALPAA